MFNRNRLWYISLVVAAYMVGVSNLWKFPALVLKYGLGGLLSYILVVTVMVPLIATAMVSTKNKGYELAEFYSREFNTVWPAMAFFLFDIILLLYYPIVSGWFLGRLAPTELLPPDVWSAAALLLFFALLTITLRKGENHTMDVMVVSLVIAFAALILVSWSLYSRIETMGTTPVFKNQLLQVLTWRGVSSRMLVEMAKQAAYSVGIGMGFYLVLGSFLSEKTSPVKIATVGVILDTLAGVISTLIMVMAISVSPSASIQGNAVVISTLPETLVTVGMKPALYFLYLAFFFAALSSMIPLGEVVTRVLMELSRKPLNPRRLPGFRKKSVLLVMSFTLLLGLSMVAVRGYTGLDVITVLDTAAETFILFGAILEVLAVLYGKSYIPGAFKVGSYPGIVSLFILGTLAVWGMIADRNLIPLSILLVVLGLALIPGKFWRKHLQA
ncbi:sodium-dependent transporter [Thermococcus sp.]|uniref:sodium-dependent transporter n=1 Tax=Thermococcus sp. TaxID=35749 RepID=UPI00260B6249|nr:sodium-dependent transporter [Thermococcus sp.]